MPDVLRRATIIYYLFIIYNADVVKLVDTLSLGGSGASRASSNLAIGTIVVT